MKTRTLLTLMAVSGAYALIACSSEEADKYGSSDSFCAAKAEAECRNVAKRCGVTETVCQTTRKATCTTTSAAAVNQGREYHSDAVQDCLDKIDESYKGDITPEGEKAATTVCDRVFTGSKQSADPCANTFECSGSLICDRGVCVNEENVTLKSQCNNAGQICETGTYCQASGGTGVKFCVAKNKLGDACGTDNPCLETLRCVNSCVAKVTVGNPCDNDGECAVEAPLCDTTTRKCRPKYESTSSACKEYSGP